MPALGARAKGLLRGILTDLRARLIALMVSLPAPLAARAKGVVDNIDIVARKADSKIDEAIDELSQGLEKSLDDGADYEAKGATKDLNTRSQVAEDPPPLPKPEPTKVSPSGGGRSGKRTKINPDDDAATKRSLQRENEAADKLADNGYTVEQNPPARPNGKEPDYRIEGEDFDCYSPGPTKSPRGIWSEVEDKVGKGQTERIVINLDDWGGDIDALRKQFADWPIDGLQEVLVVKGSSVMPL
jgi:hypothetical protein